MDLNALWTTLGIFLGLISILIGIYQCFTLRKVEITYLCKKSVLLLNEFGKGISDLQIKYKDEPVEKNLLFLQSYLINTGNKDVTPQMVESDIQMFLPQEFSFVELKVTDNSKFLRTETSIINHQTVQFKTGLWKRKEYLKFDALIAVPIKESKEDYESVEKKINEKINFQVRIADTEKIKKSNIPVDEMNGNYFVEQFHSPLPKMFKFMMASTTLFMSILLLIFYKIDPERDIYYKIKINDKEYFAKATAINDSLKLRIDDGQKRCIYFKDFPKYYNGEISVKPKNNKALSIIWICYSLFCGVYILLYFFQRFKQKRFLKYIK